MKLNIGCGADYRFGFINIDASSELNKVDKIINISVDSLADHFEKNSVDFILANDIRAGLAKLDRCISEEDAL